MEPSTESDNVVSGKIWKTLIIYGDMRIETAAPGMSFRCGGVFVI